jgi:hypothetical protein
VGPVPPSFGDRARRMALRIASSENGFSTKVGHTALVQRLSRPAMLGDQATCRERRRGVEEVARCDSACRRPAPIKALPAALRTLRKGSVCQAIART